jgi:hypothetical protein
MAQHPGLPDRRVWRRRRPIWTGKYLGTCLLPFELSTRSPKGTRAFEDRHVTDPWEIYKICTVFFSYPAGCATNSIDSILCQELC